MKPPVHDVTLKQQCHLLCSQAKIPVYTHGNLDTPHLHLEANGTGKYPKLTFDVPEVMLPPVSGPVAKRGGRGGKMGD